jgi:hypothetical protein
VLKSIKDILEVEVFEVEVFRYGFQMKKIREYRKKLLCIFIKKEGLTRL